MCVCGLFGILVFFQVQAQDSKVLVVHGYVPQQCVLQLNQQPITMVTFSLTENLEPEQQLLLGELAFRCNHQGPVELLTNVIPPYGSEALQPVRPVVQLEQGATLYRADAYGYVYVNQPDSLLTLSVVNTGHEAVTAGTYRAYFQVVGY